MVYQNSSNQQSLALAEEDDMSYAQDESYDDYGQYGDQSGYDGQLIDPNMTAGADGNKELSMDDLEQFVAKDEATVKWFCIICSKFSHASKNNVINHVESKHFSGAISHFCHLC